MKITVSVKTKRRSEREHLLKSLPNLHGTHRLSLRVLLSDSLLQSVDCDQGAAFHEQLAEIDDDDHAALDHLANTFTSIPTFVGLMHHAVGVWVVAQLKEIGLHSSAKIRENEPASPPTATLEAKSDTSESTNKTDGQSPGTVSVKDAQFLERLRRVDPTVYQFVQERDIRLIARPKWSWPFEWMRTTFDLEERSDSSGTYYAFLYSPDLSEYEKLTYLIGVIRRDPGFRDWLKANEIDERGPSGISPAPGTPEYRDYQEQLKEQSYALMAELGATPEEIAARRRDDIGNEWLGQQGLLIEILQAAGAARQVSPSARRGTPGRWAAKPPRRRRRQPPNRPTKGVQANSQAGNAARDEIAAREAPVSKERRFETAAGSRFSDVLKEGKERVVIESKVGLTSLSKVVKQQLARDWWLRHEGKVDRVIWEFTRSKVTGEVGPNEPLRKILEKLGFEIRINP